MICNAKLPYADIFTGSETWVRTLQQQQKCVNFSKFANCKEYKSQSFVNTYAMIKIVSFHFIIWKW